MSNPYGSDARELAYLRMRRDQRAASDGPYNDEARIAALDARIAELEAALASA